MGFSSSSADQKRCLCHQWQLGDWQAGDLLCRGNTAHLPTTQWNPLSQWRVHHCTRAADWGPACLCEMQTGTHNGSSIIPVSLIQMHKQCTQTILLVLQYMSSYIPLIPLSPSLSHSWSTSNQVPVYTMNTVCLYKLHTPLLSQRHLLTFCPWVSAHTNMHKHTNTHLKLY